MTTQVLLSLIYLFLLPLFDRWGGGGFDFLPAWIPIHPILKVGIKPIRRFGIPSLLLLLSPTLLGAISAALVCLFFCLPLDEYSEGAHKFWLSTFGYTIPLVLGLLAFSGPFFFIAPLVWLSGIYLSNVGVAGRKLPWHYVELLRGLAIALGALLHYAL